MHGYGLNTRNGRLFIHNNNTKGRVFIFISLFVIFKSHAIPAR